MPLVNNLVKKRVYSRVLGNSVKIPNSILKMDEGADRDTIMSMWLSSYETLKATNPLSLGDRVRMGQPLCTVRQRKSLRQPSESSVASLEAEAIILGYTTHLMAVGSSPLTAQNHASALRNTVLPCAMSGGRLGSHLSSIARATSPQSWSKILSRNLLTYCLHKKLSGGETRKSFSVATRLIDWLSSIDVIAAGDRVAAPPLPRRTVGRQCQPPAAPRGLVRDDEDFIFCAMENRMTETPFGATQARELRLWTEVCLMAGFALRPGEAAAITLADFVLDSAGDPTHIRVSRQMTAVGPMPPKSFSHGTVPTIEGRELLAQKAKEALVWMSTKSPLTPFNPRLQIKIWLALKPHSPFSVFTLKDFRREAAGHVYIKALKRGDDGIRSAAEVLRHKNLTTSASYLRVSSSGR